MQAILDILQSWQSQLLSKNTWFAAGVLVIAAMLAWLIHRRWDSMIQKKLGENEQKGLFRAALRGTLRIIFPFSMLFLLLIGKSILASFNITSTLLDIFVPLLLSLALIRLIVYTLRRGSTPNAALRAWEGIISTSIWILVAFHLLGWLPGILAALDGLAITVGDAHISILSVIKTILAISAFIVMANWLSTLIDRKVRRSIYLSSSMRVGISKISRLFLFSLAILTGLHTVGIDLTALTVFGGALGVGLGFGLQRIASNIISGFILLFDRSIKPGDVISIGERFGWVQTLHARYIVVRDRDGVETLIPNENLITSEVTNWSYTDRQVRVKIPVQISYSDNPEIAMELMVKATEYSKRILQDPPVQCRLTGFGDSGINLELRIWLSDPEAGVSNVKSEINLMIWKLFKEHTITIPYPQREVRML